MPAHPPPAHSGLDRKKGRRKRGTSPIPDQRPRAADGTSGLGLRRNDAGAGAGADGAGRRDPRPVPPVRRPGPGAQPGPGTDQRGAVPGGPSQRPRAPEARNHHRKEATTMNRRIPSLLPGRKGGRIAMLGVVVAGSLAIAGYAGTSASAAPAAPARASQPPEADGLGQLSGLLPRNHLPEESALQVALSPETVRLPLYPGTAYAGTPHAEKVWYLLLDASDAGLAHDLGVNFAPKLANIAISDPAAVQTVTLDSPTPAQNPFGPAVVNFAGAPDFSPTRIATPGPNGCPLANFQPGSVAGPGYSPFIKIAGSNVVYNAPIVAVGDGPFDVVHHTNTGDRVLNVHIAGPSAPGQFAESYVDMLFVKGVDARQTILYLTTDAGQPLTAVLERSTYVPALDSASFNGGDDFLGSARERLFGFINGQTGADNPQAQGFQNLALDGSVGENASQENTKFIN